MMYQDAFFTQALEALCRYFNEMISVERQKLLNKSKRR